MNGPPGARPSTSFLLAGLALCVIVVAVDAISDRVILIPLLVAAPLVTALRGTARQTLLVGAVAVLCAVGLGWVDDIEGTRRHGVAIATTAAGAVLAGWLAAARDRERSTALPALEQAVRLRAALTIGRMGEWSWNRATGEVVWDDNVRALFGRYDNQFRGTFDAWMELIDERDRIRVQQTVDEAVATGSTFRFDHRCTWTDGSIHWVEGIGELIVENELVLGAFGLAIDVDDRYRQIDERNRLVELERRERRRVEFLAGVHDVLALSVSTDEIVARVATAVIPELAEWCSIVVAADRPPSRPLITVAHHDPAKVDWASEVQHEHPYDPDARFGAANVIRTGRRELVEHVDPAIFDLPGGDLLRRAGLGSLLTVPLIGAVGTLGAIQLIRGPERPPFTAEELEFVDEVAARVGSALNTAVLFERQARSRAALDTLQQVSGRIASMATPREVMRASLEYGARGIGANAATLFLTDGDELVARETVGSSDAHYDAKLVAAREAVAAGTLSSRQVPRCGTVVAVPMQIMHRTTGVIVLVVDDDRLLTTEEMSMLVTLGSRCAGALERASLYERERDVALALQHRLLSVMPTTPPWLDAAARYVPATALDIGGDWFQVLDADNGRIAAIVGDAVGHGIASAAAMGQLRASIATAVANDPRPGRTLAAADLFARQGADTSCASVGSILLDPGGRARYACAGLPPPVLVRADHGAAFLVDGRRPLLGIGHAGVEYPEGIFEFSPGDLLVAYTDGLVERRGEHIDTGLDRLLRSVEEHRHLAPDALCDRLLAEVPTDEPEDDIAVLILRRVAVPSQGVDAGTSSRRPHARTRRPLSTTTRDVNGPAEGGAERLFEFG